MKQSDLEDILDDDDDMSDDVASPFSLGPDSIVGKIMGYWAAADTAFRSGKKVYDFVNKQRSLTVTVTSKDVLFIPALDWISSEEFGGTAKEVALVSRSSFDYDRDEKVIAPLKVVQNATTAQTIRLGGHKIKVQLNEPSAQTSSMRGNSETNTSNQARLIFTTRSRDAHELLLEKLFSMHESYVQSVRPPRLYTPGAWGGFRTSESMPPRSLDSVILKDGELAFLTKDIADFLASEDKYNRLGIPWHRGYLLHGIPGTGKTSIAKAVSGYFGMDVYYVPLGDIKDDNTFQQLLAEIRPKSVLLLEDVDVFNAATSRDAEKGELSLSGLLNALDGIQTPHGMITIMTTNNKDELDSALIRPGRIDVEQEFTALDQSQSERLFKHFYGAELPYERSLVGLAPAEVVGVFKQHLDDAEAALSKFKVKTIKKKAAGKVIG